MYKYKKKAGLMACLAVLALAASACTSANSATGAKKSSSGQKVIGVDLYSQVQRRWQFDAKAMQDEAAKLGDKLIINYANTDLSKQQNDVQSMLNRNVDALIMAPVDTKGSGALVSQAQQSKVPVVDYDIALDPSAPKPDALVVRPQTDACKMQVDAAIKSKPSGNYALIKGDAGNDLAQTCSKVWAAELKSHPSIKVVYNDFTPGYDPAKALTTAEDVLNKHKNVAAFVVNNDGMATGVLQAVQRAGLSGKVFISGLDGDPANLQAIAKGYQTMSVWTQIDDEGRKAVRAADALARGKKPAADTDTNGVPTVYVKLNEITKDNMCDFVHSIAPAGWVTAKQVFPTEPNKCG